jgi:hypothetical protein
VENSVFESNLEIVDKNEEYDDRRIFG